jgi:hypothetical protein
MIKYMYMMIGCPVSLAVLWPKGSIIRAEAVDDTIRVKTRVIR